VPRVIILDDASGARTVDVANGLSLMEGLRLSGIGLEGECNGSLACATCHIWVHPTWMDRFDPPSEGEESMLDVAFDLSPTSRLACQIPVTDAVDGLMLRLPSGASSDWPAGE
jgi:2Fe-2S ferredoxin